jgi:hypothetical protein
MFVLWIYTIILSLVLCSCGMCYFTVSKNIHCKCFKFKVITCVSEPKWDDGARNKINYKWRIFEPCALMTQTMLDCACGSNAGYSRSIYNVYRKTKLEHGPYKTDMEIRS